MYQILRVQNLVFVLCFKARNHGLLAVATCQEIMAKNEKYAFKTLSRGWKSILERAVFLSPTGCSTPIVQ